MNGLRLLEIALFELFDLLPNLVLAIIPFQNHMRYSKKVMGGIVAVLYLILTCSRIIGLSNWYAAVFLSILLMVLYLLFYRICFLTEIVKLLFVLLIILNYGSFSAIIVNYIIYYRLDHVAARTYSIHTTLVFIGVLIFSYPVMFIMMNKKIRPLITESENNKIWKYLWMVPATPCLSYYYNVFVNGGVISFAEKPSNVLFAVGLNAGSLFVTYIVANLVEQSNTYMRLKSEHYQLNMQFVQYENLKNRIEEARRARHDLRQVMAVIQSYLAHDDKPGLLKYIQQYVKSLPSNEPIVYCHSYALNALLVYYADMAREKNISFEVRNCHLPEHGISESDAAILFGNLLENALEACTRQEEEKSFIVLNIEMIEQAVIITLDNSFHGIIQKNGNIFLSSKGNREGIGITSIQKLAEKYGGLATFDYDEGTFRASVFLYP